MVSFCGCDKDTLTKAAFLLTVLSERPEHHSLAFRVGMFALELQRPPASTKALEVRGSFVFSLIISESYALISMEV